MFNLSDSGDIGIEVPMQKAFSVVCLREAYRWQAALGGYLVQRARLSTEAQARGFAKSVFPLNWLLQAQQRDRGSCEA